MTGTEKDSERIRVLRELLMEAEGEISHTVDEAVSRQGAMMYLSRKLEDAERMQAHGS